MPTSKPQTGPRPQAKTLVTVDANNPYASLGVSPLESTEGIHRIGTEKINELKARLRKRSTQQFRSEEMEIIRIQGIIDQIGKPRPREQYDQAHPQSRLLTVQPSPRDRRLEPRARAGAVTAWLLERLGPQSLLPSPESLRLIAPGELRQDIVNWILQSAVTRQETLSADAGAIAPAPRAEEPLAVTELQRIHASLCEPLEGKDSFHG